MLKKILVLCLFLIFCEKSFAQNTSSNDYSNLVCKYHVTYLRDSTDINNEKSELMTLLIGNHVSLYTSDQKATADSLKTSIIKNSIDKSANSNLTGLTIDFSKVPKVNLHHEVLFRNDEFTIYDKVFKYLFSYPPDNKVIWTLTKESKMIGEYLCYKAFGVYGNRKLVAWYTESVPIPEGPYTFKGLPGLIIALNDNSNSYTFQLVYLKNEKREILPMKNAVNTTYEKFTKARQDSKDNVANNVQSVLHREMTDQEKDLVKRNAIKPNNYLD